MKSQEYGVLSIVLYYEFLKYLKIFLTCVSEDLSHSKHTEGQGHVEQRQKEGSTVPADLRSWSN